MPLRDHFRPPVDLKHRWDALHTMWPATIVQWLFSRLPEGYAAAPGVHRVSSHEIDEPACTEDEPLYVSATEEGTGIAAPPTSTLVTSLPDQEEYEVRIYDHEYGRTLVAAIEIVSPSNKDRPDSRRAFVAKTAALLQKGVCVSIIDLVTVRQFNLYADLLELVGRSDPALGAEPPYIYAVTIRGRKRIRKRPLLENWFYPLQVGQPLPALPVWLEEDRGLMVELEPTYEEACRVLHIR